MSISNININMSSSIQTITAEQAYNDIKRLTHNFESLKSPTIVKNGEEKPVGISNYINEVDKSLTIDPNQVVYFDTIPAPSNLDVNRAVIGKAGCYFYLTTKHTHVLFIWHNRENKTYEFWSLTESALNHAINQIQYRIDMISADTRVNRLTSPIPINHEKTPVVSPMPINITEETKENNEPTTFKPRVECFYKTPIQPYKTKALPSTPLKRTYATVSARPIQGRKLEF